MKDLREIYEEETGDFAYTKIASQRYVKWLEATYRRQPILNIKIYGEDLEILDEQGNPRLFLEVSGEHLRVHKVKQIGGANDYKQVAKVKIKQEDAYE